RQDSQWQDQYWDDWSWYESEESYAAKGKGKKGKKGKGKGKFSKDGKDGKSGKDGQSQLAEASSSSVTAATTFYAEYINPLNFSFMATEDKKEEAFISQPLTPTAMVLDLGCTRAMASRVAARFCDDNPNCGIWYTIAETMSQFTFANSESTKRKQKLIICMYDREYAVQSTEFDIVEQGHVPILMSLPQMRNLRLHLAHTWYLISLTSVRRTRYEPKEGAVPIPLEYLDNKRKTITELSKGKNVAHEDDWRSPEPPTSKVTEPWKGRLDLLMKNLAKVSLKTAQREQEHPESLHQVAGAPLAPEDDPDLQECEPSLPEEPDISALEPRRIALPLPGQEVSRASPQYQRMLEKLNNDVELYKLHVKHYHMSSAQFRRRTSMLGLPGEIYDKYDRIVKGCRVCSTSVPTPPRARIAGLRASSFGDLIFVDHEEIKFGTKAYLALVIIDGASNLLWVTALTSLEAPETLGAFRQWTEENNCIPKGIVGDQAFFAPPLMSYYKFHGITPYPCGLRTPWPNRAETAVRLFKRTWSIMAKALADEGHAERVTVRQAVKKVAWARNCQLTVSGYSPLEIATGRRPPDLFDVETSTPEQLRRIEPLSIFRGLPCVLIKKPGSRLTFGRVWQDVSCHQMVLTRREIVCLSGIRMNRRRSPKVFGSEELSYLKKAPWCWLKFIVRYCESISRRFAVMVIRGMMWQFLLSLPNREALLRKRYAMMLRD
ncbi:lgrC, partial [Symbiodinium microadriaticum]